MRVVAQLKAQAAEGALSAAQLEARMELAFRARTRPDLEAALGGLEGNARARAAAASAYGLGGGAPAKRRRSPVERQLLTGAVFLVFWLVVCAVTGVSATWYLVTIFGSMMGTAFRIARGKRRRSRFVGRNRSRV